MQKLLHADYEKSSSEVIVRTIIQLDEYFGRKRTAFDIPLFFVGTDFQKTVWKELLNIPYGMTLSYGDLSRKLGYSRCGCRQWGESHFNTCSLSSRDWQ